MGDNNTSEDKKKKHKIRDASPTERGTANRGIPYKPESNAFEPAVVPEVPGKIYKLTGLQTSYAGTGKPGVAKGLDDIYEQWRNAPGSELRVTGSTSKSVVPGVDDEGLQRKRAVSVKDYFVKKGVPSSQIHTGTFGSNNLDPRAISPESKAAMRGATIEIVKPEPPHPPPHPLGNYPDPVQYVTREPWKPPRIPWQPTPIDWRDRLRKDKKNKRDDDPPTIGPDYRFDNTGAPLIFIIGGITIIGVYGFLEIYLEDVALEYGVELGKQFARYVKKKIREGPNARNGVDEARFMSIMLNKILARGNEKGKRHPLHFLVNFKKEDWVSRSKYHHLGVNAGHVLSRGEYGFSFAIEDATQNQEIRGLAERRNNPVYSMPFVIDGIPVDEITARIYEREGLLPSGTCAKAKRTVGWINWYRIANYLGE